MRADTPIAAFKWDFPLGVYQRVVAMDEEDRVCRHRAAGRGSRRCGRKPCGPQSLHYTDTVLLPQMTIKEAVAMLENAESDALAVVDGPETSA